MGATPADFVTTGPEPCRNHASEAQSAHGSFEITLTVNGTEHTIHVEPRWSLADVLRDRLSLTGTHLGCEHGACGACTVLLDGDTVRSCLLFAVQADGHEVETVEGLADGEVPHALQAAFQSEHGLQCGFCTPGMLMSLRWLLSHTAHPSDAEVRAAIAGNLCRCTGYTNIVRAAHRAAANLAPRQPRSRKDP